MDDARLRLIKELYYEHVTLRADLNRATAEAKSAARLLSQMPTVREAAKRLGVPHAYVSDLMRGKK